MRRKQKLNAAQLRQTISRKQATITRLQKLLKMQLTEMAERGKELEQVRKMLIGWDSKLPTLYAESMREIIDGYIERNQEKYSMSRKGIKI